MSRTRKRIISAWLKSSAIRSRTMPPVRAWRSKRSSAGSGRSSTMRRESCRRRRSSARNAAACLPASPPPRGQSRQRGWALKLFTRFSSVQMIGAGTTSAANVVARAQAGPADRFRALRSRRGRLELGVASGHPAISGMRARNEVGTPIADAKPLFEYASRLPAHVPVGGNKRRHLVSPATRQKAGVLRKIRIC